MLLNHFLIYNSSNSQSNSYAFRAASTPRLLVNNQSYHKLIWAYHYSPKFNYITFKAILRDFFSDLIICLNRLWIGKLEKKLRNWKKSFLNPRTHEDYAFPHELRKYFREFQFRYFQFNKIFNFIMYIDRLEFVTIILRLQIHPSNRRRS